MFFEEKSRQLSVCELVAFGIPISSRYARADELSEMLMFAKEVALCGLQGCVKNVFYDSPACFCIIDLHDNTARYDNEGCAIRTCAEKTIAQFEWGGCVYHRNDTANLQNAYLVTCITGYSTYHQNVVFAERLSGTMLADIESEMMSVHGQPGNCFQLASIVPLGMVDKAGFSKETELPLERG